MKVRVDLPAAWFWLPASEAIVSNPDLDDDPPRYGRALPGGWGGVGECVTEVMRSINRVLFDPLELRLDIPCAGVDTLNRDQQRVVETWFRTGELELSAPEIDWIDGRHRSWGLKSAGCDAIPSQLAPVADAIRLWYPDPNGWGPLDRESVEVLEELCDWWYCGAIASWRAMNPAYGRRLEAIVRNWKVRVVRP